MPTRLFIPSTDRKALPEGPVRTDAAEPETVPAERRYLDADQREREMTVQLEKARQEKQEAIKALGGEAQAGKLIALPRKL